MASFAKKDIHGYTGLDGLLRGSNGMLLWGRKTPPIVPRRGTGG